MSKKDVKLKSAPPSKFLYIILPLSATLLLSFVIFVVINCLYLAGQEDVVFETIFQHSDTLNYSGLVLALLGTVFLGCIALYFNKIALYQSEIALRQNDDMHEREKRRDDNEYIRETYAFLTPVVVFAFHESNWGNGLAMKQSPHSEDYSCRQSWGFQFKMKASRDFVIINKARVSEMIFRLGKKSFDSGDVYKKTPFDATVQSHLLPDDKRIDHLLTFSVKLSGKPPLDLPDEIKDIQLFITYTNIFGVEVECEHRFKLNNDKTYVDPSAKKRFVDKEFLKKRYLPDYERINTIVSEIRFVEKKKRKADKKKGRVNLREIHVNEITAKVAELCIKACIDVAPDIRKWMEGAYSAESGTARQVLADMLKNHEIAAKSRLPICQDTGMAVVFLEIGQDVRVVGGDIRQAVNDGVAKGYEKGYLRKSVVADPMERTNTGDNTPAVIHFDIVPGETLRITVCPKGFGSENMSRLKMLVPADGMAGIEDFVIETVKIADANPCPPIVVGVGIGGTFDYAANMAKRALLRKIGSVNPNPFWGSVEANFLAKINALNIGPAGFGGRGTAMAVFINTYATHIAGLPVAVNLGCHVNRHEEATL